MKMPLSHCLATLVPLIAIASAACSGDDRPAFARSAGAEPGVTIVEPVSARYAPATVAAGGVIAGAVHFSGDAPVDTTVTVTRDERVCGNTLRHLATQTAGDKVGGALVWISDIRAGKAPPLSRRYELVQMRCTFGPVLQAVLAGGALNVRTHDPLLSQIVVLDTRSRDTLAVLPFTSAGSLIPLVAPLRNPSMLEIRSPTHPWMEAWVAVLDHPYFVMTDRDGSFRLEDVPAGSYELRAWHPRFGLATGEVTVSAARESEVELRFAGTGGGVSVAASPGEGRLAATAGASGRDPAPSP
jgi:hypothetical protein